ncbi:MAG: ThiF family adenylyltransferase, partial [Verrucomicrobia bacterium]|nr:ThiF family adenylyltransferase [Verrucomicrobiota bacterium]
MTMTIDHPAPASPPSARPGRASRFPAILGAPADSAERLAQVRVIVAGCGSVGLNVVSHLARMIRALMCIDSKNIKTESLQTHPVTPAEIGLAKVRVAATWAARVNPEIEVRALDGLLGQQSPYDLLGYDYLVAAVDNLRAELEANDISRALGIPLIRVSVHGETLSAQVQFFSNQSAETPCPGCVFGTRDWAEVESLRRYACDGSERPPAAEIPTMSIPSLCSLAADLCVHQLLRDVLGIGRSVRDSVLSYSAISHRALVSSLPRAPDCRASHRVLRIV